METASPETLRLGEEAGKKDCETTSSETLRRGVGAAKKDLEVTSPEALKLEKQTGKKKKKKAVEVKPLENVTLTKEEAKDLKSWLRQEILDPNSKPVDPVKLNHAFLKLMAQVALVLKLKPSQVEKYTGMKPPHQHKLRPHVNPLDDVHVSLTSTAKWLGGLHLNPAHVVERLMKQMMAVLMPFSDLAA